jgi:retron-type reverse transcriptase
MKRAGQLLKAVASPDNLRLAFWKAAKGKRAKADCRAFQQRLDGNLDDLRGDLLAGTVRVGDYHYFTIHDPKERIICAASFRERVLHHALMNVCEPVLERAAVFDSYACRRGKGRLAAVTRAQAYARRHAWFLKLDVRKYFDSIHHDTLRDLLRRKLKDAAVLALFDRIIASYHTTPGRGLPIGNLTSQHFANFYLAPLDRFVKEGGAGGRSADIPVRLGVCAPDRADRNARAPASAYVRYMDDFVIWGQSSRQLRAWAEQVRVFLAEELKLDLKPNTILNRTGFGMDFLGYRIFPRTLRLSRRSKVRFVRKLRAYEAAHRAGEWTELHLQQRMTALLAFVLPADSRGFRQHVINRFACLPPGEGASTARTLARRRQGGAALGLEPRDPRRQLEQQRHQLPRGEPQQRQPDEQEQQHRVPVRAAPSSTGRHDRAPADPAALPSLRPSGGGQIPQPRPVPVAPTDVRAKPPGGALGLTSRHTRFHFSGTH